MTKVVIFNCPPRSGKDSVANYISEMFSNFDIASFKDKLFSIAIETAPMGAEFLNIYEEYKSKPHPELGNLTTREYMIKISEEWIKPLFGRYYFGVALANEIIATAELNETIGKPKEYFLVPDGGFVEELEPLFRKFSKENILILQWDREGCTFDNDSRKYIDCYPEITIRLPSNNGNLSRFAMNVEKTIVEYFDV